MCCGRACRFGGNKVRTSTPGPGPVWSRRYVPRARPGPAGTYLVSCRTGAPGCNTCISSEGGNQFGRAGSARHKVRTGWPGPGTRDVSVRPHRARPGRAGPSVAAPIRTAWGAGEGGVRFRSIQSLYVNFLYSESNTLRVCRVPRSTLGVGEGVCHSLHQAHPLRVYFKQSLLGLSIGPMHYMYTVLEQSTNYQFVNLP